MSSAEVCGDEVRVAHLRSSALLRRWLAETHATVRPGPLRLTIGPLTVRTDVLRQSLVGAHEFGPIEVVDDHDRPLARVEPALLAAACTSAAQSRVPREAPINQAGAGSATDLVLRAVRRGEIDVLPAAGEAETLLTESVAEPPQLVRMIGSAAEAARWWDRYLENDVVPVLDDRTAASTAQLLSRQALAAVGVLARYRVCDEAELLTSLSSRLHDSADDHELLRHWLAAPTVAGVAVLNGGALHYRDRAGAVALRPVTHEVPNPLARVGLDAIPGVPLPELGDGWALRPVRAESESSPDVSLVHKWMHAEHVAATWRQDWSLPRWFEELSTQLAGDHSLPCIVSLDGREFAYVELYRVARDKIGECYPFHPRDLGVHVAVGDRQVIGRGLGTALLDALAAALFDADPECRRVVAEPDIHNGASVAAFGKAGYRKVAEVGLPDKNSVLLARSR
ncbi:GNAT family N-acetyltransferase [Allosaccharopolyspora coralli]|uniref:Lysine N-acyltransferase MbtK n=1 Tax=Allosaccharopolyspora coralli TaxID=2665642 RepID=A0A5Q3QCB5_9PSEU|nr:GNAT family N-acetyltransferase [Allosaccharopolyspora coralli]QGK69115.1 GNAT family N-acetyltransferase [Allosaccharopolyspora coralli]